MHALCMHLILSRCGALYRLFSLRSFHNLLTDRRNRLHTFFLYNAQQGSAGKICKILFIMVSFKSTVENVFKKAFDFSGRATRAEFWWWTLCNVLITTICSLIGIILGEVNGIPATAISCGIWGLITFIPGLSLLIRRLHDSSKSAWHLLWYLLPYVGAIVVFVMTLLPSAPDNKYGPANNQ